SAPFTTSSRTSRRRRWRSCPPTRWGPGWPPSSPTSGSGRQPRTRWRFWPPGFLPSSPRSSGWRPPCASTPACRRREATRCAPRRTITRAASVSLYRLLEKQPADIAALLAPLHPNMFNNPAADIQQPIGDAIVVAGRVAALGAKVTIRLADWFPGWPYNFTSMTDWFDKLGQTVSRRQAANLTNIYAYEIWNEPNGTWKSSKPLSFNEFRMQYYVKIR